MNYCLHFLSALILLAYLLLSISGIFSKLLDLVAARKLFKLSLVLQWLFFMLFAFSKVRINFLNSGDYLFALSFILPLGFYFFTLKTAPLKLISIVAFSALILFSSSGYLSHISGSSSAGRVGTLFMLLHVLPLIIGEVAFISTALLGLFYLNQEQLVKTPVKMLAIDFSNLSLEKLSAMIKIVALIGLISLALGGLSGYSAFVDLSLQAKTNTLAVSFVLCSCLILALYLLFDWRTWLSKKSRITFVTYGSLVLIFSFMIFRLIFGNLAHGS